MKTIKASVRKKGSAVPLFTTVDLSECLFFVTCLPAPFAVTPEAPKTPKRPRRKS